MINFALFLCRATNYRWIDLKQIRPHSWKKKISDHFAQTEDWSVMVEM